MKYTYTAKKMELKNALKERAEKKLSKLDKFFDSDSVAGIVFSAAEKGKKSFEVTISNRGINYRTEQQAEDMYEAIDKAVNQLVRQILKHKTKLEKRVRTGAFDFKADEYINNAEEKEFNVIKTKNFNVKPMSVDEAILQLNMIGHEFFVFREESSEKINIVYRRHDGNYGLIIPE